MLPGPRPMDPVIPDPNIASTSGTKKRYDFRFELQPAAVTLVRNAIAPISEPEFSYDDSGFIRVSDAGFEIIVQFSTGFDDDKELCTGYLGLYAERLDQFVCNKFMRKKVSLKDVSLYLDTAAADDTVAIYVESDTDLLSFDFRPAAHNALGPNTMATKFLLEEEPTNISFPAVSYGLEAVIPSVILTVMSITSLEKEFYLREDHLDIYIQPTTIRTQVGAYRFETEAENIQAWWTWPYWESMRKATIVADECTMYLVVDPPHNIMLKFNVGELGYLVFLKYDALCFNTVLPIIGQFIPLR